MALVYNARMTGTKPTVHDLHSHSTASDGSLAPAELVRRAAEAGIDVLALTDHDTTDGLAEAEAAARRMGLVLVPGVEISVTWRKGTVHILGLGIDRQSPVLQSGLQRLQAWRAWRAEEIGRRLEKAGIPDALAGARRHARGRIVGRTHFARFLVESGRCKDMKTVFKRYLVKNRPGHVPGQWASLEEAVHWIREAGGQAVIAHPARYGFTATRLRELIGEFMECGGTGLEVVSGSHDSRDISHMARVASRHGLLASAGSDYHGPESPYIQLGRLPPLPGDCIPIWSAWNAPIETKEASATAS